MVRTSSFDRGGPAAHSDPEHGTTMSPYAKAATSAGVAMGAGCGQSRSGANVTATQRAAGGGSEAVSCLVEVSERLVGSPAFKAGVRGDPS